MTAQKMVQAYKAQAFETTSARELVEDWGMRIRQSKATRAIRPDVWEVGSTYYYQSQNQAAMRMRELAAFAALHGYTVRPLAWEHGWPVCDLGLWREDNVLYAGRPWPKDSWATVYVEIEKAPACPMQTLTIEMQQSIGAGVARALVGLGLDAHVAEWGAADALVNVTTDKWADTAAFLNWFYNAPELGRYHAFAIAPFVL